MNKNGVFGDEAMKDSAKKAEEKVEIDNENQPKVENFEKVSFEFNSDFNESYNLEF